MAASPKLAPPEPSAPTPRKRAPRSPSPEQVDPVDAVKAAKRAELVRKLKGIGLILFGLFLAAALAAIGFASLRNGFNASGTVGLTGRRALNLAVRADALQVNGLLSAIEQSCRSVVTWWRVLQCGSSTAQTRSSNACSRCRAMGRRTSPPRSMPLVPNSTPRVPNDA